MFGFVHGNNLVYNTCWEDPRLDHVALELGPTDRVMMITSAGCNALDYALKSPARIHCVDVNPRQNALLELKQQCIRKLDYDDFFAFFGRGGIRTRRRCIGGNCARVSRWKAASTGIATFGRFR